MGGKQSVNENISPIISRPYENILETIKSTAALNYVASYEYPRCLIVEKIEENVTKQKPRRLGSYRCAHRYQREENQTYKQAGRKSCCSDPSETTIPHDESTSPINGSEDIPVTGIMTEYVDLYSSLGTLKHTTQTNDTKQKLRGKFSKKQDYCLFSLATDSLIEIPVFGVKSNHKPFLEPQIFLSLLPFIMNSSLPLCLRVCSHWFITIYSYLQQLVSPILRDFVDVYKDYLHLETSTFSIQPLYTAETSVVRVDVLLYAKILPKCVKECTQFGYTFEYQTLCLNCRSVNVVKNKNILEEGENEFIFHDPPAILPPAQGDYDETHEDSTKKIYKSLFRFETCKQNTKRQIWFQRDICRFHGDELMVASFPSVPTLNVGDFIEIPLNLSNALGIVSVPSIQWVQIEQIKDTIERAFGQRCEIDQQKSWMSLDMFQPTTSERIQVNDFFEPQWKHLKTEFSGIDIIYSRSSYVANVTGNVPKAQKWLGTQAMVTSSESRIVYPLSRLGLQHDRFTTHQLRRGDYITVYLSQGGGVVL